MYVLETGQENETVVVFLHGGGVAGWMWEKQRHYFDGYHVLIPDLPGHGKSAEEPFVSIQHTAQRMIQMLEEKAKGKKIIAVGFSLGAQIVLEILGQAADFVQTAMINSPLVCGKRWMVPLMNPLLHLSYPLIQTRWFAKKQANALFVPPHHFEQYVRESKLLTKENLLQIVKENMHYRLPEAFSRTTANILVTAGEKENEWMKQSLDLIEKSHPAVQTMLLPDMGHGFPLSHPTDFNLALEVLIDAQKKKETS